VQASEITFSSPVIHAPLRQDAPVLAVIQQADLAHRDQHLGATVVARLGAGHKCFAQPFLVQSDRVRIGSTPVMSSTLCTGLRALVTK
jgi:hypothetical protein